MKEKVWKDCPVCGAIGSMKLKNNETEVFKTRSGIKKTVSGLSFYTCENCNEGIPTNATRKKMNSITAELKAMELSKTTVATEIASVEYAAKATGTTRQSVHKMMNSGRLGYVIVAGLRLPLKIDIERIEKIEKKTVKRLSLAKNKKKSKAG